LKWVPVSGAIIAAFSVVGGVLMPEHMMFVTDSEKAIIANVQLAGPFEHSNILGLYCVLSLALTPLIVSLRWKVINGLILCAAIVASASRTALVATVVLALWWMIYLLRSKVSLRNAATVLICLSAVAVVVVPHLSWDPDALSGRPYIWSASLNAWRESRLVGQGMNWFATRSPTLFVLGDYVSAGHNLVVDTLVTSGLVGVCIVIFVFLSALRSTLAMDITSHQIACFGYLITFLVASATEAIWSLLPDMQLFPVVGLVFAVIVVARHRPPGEVTEPVAAAIDTTAATQKE
jgi:O-antigen ligase